MRRDYEVGVVVRLESSDDAINDSIEQIKNWIEEDEMGQVVRIDRWGRRKLAYEIDRQREGFYVFLYSQIEPEHLQELEQNLRLASTVLRYLIVRAEG